MRTLLTATLLATTVAVVTPPPAANAETCSNRVAKVHDYMNHAGRTVRVSGVLWYERCTYPSGTVNRTVNAYGGQYEVVDGSNSCGVSGGPDIQSYTVNVNTDHDWWEPGAITVDCQNDGANTASHGAGSVGARALQFRATTRMNRNNYSDLHGGTGWESLP